MGGGGRCDGLRKRLQPSTHSPFLFRVVFVVGTICHTTCVQGREVPAQLLHYSSSVAMGDMTRVRLE